MLFSTIFLILLFDFAETANVNVYVNTNSPMYTVPDRFLGVTLDESITYSSNWYGLNFTFIEPLARGLGPSYFRFGGNRADTSIFMENASVAHGNDTFTYNIITAAKVDLLANFANNVGWRLIYDLNDLLRIGSNFSTSTWNSTNAQSFINYTSSKGYNMDFELGNEPEQYQQKFNVSLTGQQIAEGYLVLRNLLNSNSLYNNSILIGPSVGSGTSTGILKDFLNNSGGNAINALTFHHYFFDGTNATVANYTDPKIMDSLLYALLDMKSLNFTPIWLSETATDWCSCAYNFSAAFIGGFLWLDKIGLSASNGIAAVLREDIFEASFGLLDSSMYPRHDYWLTFLHKKLVGTQIYNVTVDQQNSSLRLYGASSRNTNTAVVYGVNIANASFTLDFPEWTNRQVVAYVLKEGVPGNFQSQNSTLNGQLLQWATHQPITNNNGQLTNLPIVLPAYSQFFVVQGENSTQACPQGWYKESSVSNKCIKFLTSYPQPWFSNNFDCATYGSNSSFLSIENASENSEIAQQANNTGCAQFFIGLYRNGSNWLWSNSDSSAYRNWSSGFPTNDTTQNCVVFDVKTGTWFNSDCDTSQCYVCQKRF